VEFQSYFICPFLTNPDASRVLWAAVFFGSTNANNRISGLWGPSNCIRTWRQPCLKPDDIKPDPEYIPSLGGRKAKLTSKQCLFRLVGAKNPNFCILFTLNFSSLSE
jgi:hypothetical protein